MKWNSILLLLALILIALLFYSRNAHGTTTTTTLTPFHKSFLELCKVDANKLNEPYKTQVKAAQTAANCGGN